MLLFEEPEPDEPDEPDETESAVPPTVTGTAVPASGSGNDWEYRVEPLTDGEVADAAGLADRLNRGAADGWHLVQVVEAGSGRILVLRRQKRPERNNRPVGFAVPARVS